MSSKGLNSHSREKDFHGKKLEFELSTASSKFNHPFKFFLNLKLLNQWFKFGPDVGSSATWLKFIELSPWNLTKSKKK